MRLSISAAVAAVVAVFLFGFVAQAQAHHDGQGQWGTYVFKHGSCNENYTITAHPPVMYATGNGALQWVAFRTELQQFDGSTWRIKDSSPWKYTKATSQFAVAVNWVDANGYPVYGHHTFAVPDRGGQYRPVWYRLVTRFYWYGDATRSYGRISDVNPVLDDREANGLSLKTYDYCKWPGANELTIIG